MGARLKLVLKNRTLKLAFKAFALAFSLFFSIYASSLYAAVVFTLLFIWWYFRPSIEIGKFWLEALLVLGAIFLRPHGLNSDVLFIFSVSIGIFLMMIIALKNILIIKRNLGKFALRLSIIALYNYLFFYNNLGLVSSLLLFAVMAIMLNNIYQEVTNLNKARLAAFIYGLVMVQLNWVLISIPNQIFVKLLFSTVVISVLSYALLRYFSQTFHKKIMNHSFAYFGVALLLLIIFMF